MQMVSIIDQTVALTMQLTAQNKNDPDDLSVWYVPACSTYLCKYIPTFINKSQSLYTHTF